MTATMWRIRADFMTTTNRSEKISEGELIQTLEEQVILRVSAIDALVQQFLFLKPKLREDVEALLVENRDRPAIL